jgi:catechol 2,3-dioxygenase-like lactoylglutathione lyase family enzyme
MARRIQVSIDCADPERLARFWAQALDYRPADPPPGFASWAAFSRSCGAAGEAWCALHDAAGLGPRILFHRVPEGKCGKNRLHLDIRVSGTQRRTDSVDAEVLRLVAAGARHLRTVRDETDYFAVLQDPEGNEFCVN